MKLSGFLLTVLFALLISRAVVAEEFFGDPGSPVAGKVLKTPVHAQDAEELRYLVLKKLLEAYAKEQDIASTKDEIEAYQAAMKEFMRKDRAEKEAARDELKRQLAAEGVSPGDRERIENDLKQAEEFLSTLPSGTPVETKEEKKAREQIATAFVLQWKINQALHKQFGGRIGFQQGGPEPLDALRKFLLERKARGDFSIADKELETAFWGYFFNDGIPQFYKPGSDEEKRAFTTPPWAAVPGAPGP